MNIKNLLIDITVIVSIFGIGWFAATYYKDTFVTVMLFPGGWQIGSWLREFVRFFPLKS